MDSDVRLHCPNCGADFAPPSPHDSQSEPTGYACPVCQFQVSATDAPTEASVSLDDLQAELETLLSHARSSGVPVDDITRMLRDELEFHAELGHGGRRFAVQIIDLGPQSSVAGNAPHIDGRELLHSRGQPLDQSN